MSLALPHEVLIVDCNNKIASAMRLTSEQDKAGKFTKVTTAIVVLETAQSLEDDAASIVKDLEQIQGFIPADDTAGPQCYKHVVRLLAASFTES